MTRIVWKVAERREKGIQFLVDVLLAACREGEKSVANRIAGALDALEVEGLAEEVVSGATEEARVHAVAALAHLRKHKDEAVATLVDCLEEADAAVRAEAIEGLFSLVGDDLGYEPDAPPDERVEAVARWRARIGEQ